MADYDLKGFQQSSKYRLGIIAGDYIIPKDSLDFHEDAREVCDHFLTLASASLLVDFKVSFFYSNLARAAANWQNFLRCHYQVYNIHAPVNYLAPFHAAIITGDLTLIKSLLASITREALEGQEYSVNLYKMRLFLLLSTQDSSQHTKAIRWHTKFQAEGGDELSTILFGALSSPDDVTESEFWDAFDALYFEYEETLKAKIGSVQTRISRFIAHRYIWFEGLCWLQLAKRYGFTLPSTNINYCPDEALLVMPEPYQDDWQIIKRDAALHNIVNDPKGRH